MPDDDQPTPSSPKSLADMTIAELLVESRRLPEAANALIERSNELTALIAQVAKKQDAAEARPKKRN
jgi:hypothetical protein